MSYRRRSNKANPVSAVKPPFISYNPHDEKNSPVMKNENIIITSIDPGIVNCGIYVGCYNTKTKSHQSIFLSRLEFRKDEESHYVNSLKKLEELEKENKFFSNSHYILIESQMAISYNNTRMGQHLISFFITSLRNKGNRPLIIEINSQSKTRLLDCPKGMKKPEYKKWCKEKALSLLQEREEKDHEEAFINCIKVAKKSDDMGDSVCQYYAWICILKGEAVQTPFPFSREGESLNIRE